MKKKKRVGFTPLEKLCSDRSEVFKEGKSSLRQCSIRKKFLTGFTLVEIMIVVGIIGILLSMAIPSYTKARMKVRDTKRKVDLKQIAGAVEQYHDDNKDYPADANTTTGDWQDAFKTAMVPYLSTLPIDPINSVAEGRFYAAARMTWSGDPNCDGHFVLWCYLENENDPDYGKHTCSFGSNHYFKVLGEY